MITKKMIRQGYENGIIEIVDDFSGIIAKIGIYWFYFAGQIGDEYDNAQKFIEDVGEDRIIQMIFNTFEDFRLDDTGLFSDEYAYYEAYLIEKLMQINSDIRLSKEIAGKLTDVINIMGLDLQRIATMLTYEHRSLQSDFAMLCMYYLKEVASDSYLYDGRNEGVHKLAKNFINPDAEF